MVNIDIKTKVFPNPTTSSLTIELDKKISAELLVYDIKGRVVIKDKLKNESGTYYIQAGPKTFTNRVIVFHKF